MLVHAVALAATLVLNTRQFDPQSAGEYDGRLRLHVASDGVVSGTFMNTEGGVSDVTGGLTGTKIWLDLAAGSASLRRYFTGTLVDGTLHATARHGPSTWILEGTPAQR